jgi:hypothetical protein
MIQIKKMSFLAAGLLAASVAASASGSETGTATISATPITGGFQYNVTLKNTSTDGSTIGTYWFSWIPGDDYMEAVPTSITFPTGWTDVITGSNNSTDGNAIQWKATSSASYIPAGGTGSFSFDSTEPLSQILGPSSFKDHEVETTAFIYSGGPFSDAGLKITATAVPEPATLGLLGISGGALLLRRKRA